MTTLYCHVTYRPIRVGWLVERSFEDLERVFANTHALWGGTYNPILFADIPQEAERLAASFGVDMLAGPSTSPVSGSTLASERILLWPFLFRPILSPDSRRCELLDIRHPAHHIQEARTRQLIGPDVQLFDATWDESDPLRFVFAAMFGILPSVEATQFPYRSFARERLTTRDIHISPEQGVPPELLDLSAPAFLANWEVRVLRDIGGPGVFVGSAESIEDLVAFWNLRARGVNVVFLDPNHRARLDHLVRHFANAIATHWREVGIKRDYLSVWSTRRIEHNDLPELDGFSGWNFEALESADVTPHARFSSLSTSASLSEGTHGLQATVALTKKPYVDADWSRDQHLVASLAFGRLYGEDGVTFRPPYVRELNERYSRDCYVLHDRCRSEPEALGVIIDAGEDHVTVNALDNDDVIRRLFQTCDVHAETSQAGRIARRLVQQMGGLQECRVFKIPGVRQLIRDHPEKKVFKHEAALQTIGKGKFTDHKDLYIEPRSTAALTPQDTFTFLLKKEVFRAGLEIRCPRCELEEWYPLDDLKTHVECGLCGHRYNILPLLPKRDWSFRSSGLFQRFEHQEGAIPVVVLLQQLEVDLREHLAAFSTGTKLRRKDGKECETDFVWVLSRDDGAPVVAIGECKDHCGIEAKDAENLGTVATDLRQHGFDVYVVFSKFDDFSPEEIQICRTLHPKTVMLSAQELEPYRIWPDERTYPSSLIGFDRLAAITAKKYFGVNATAKTDTMTSERLVGVVNHRNES